MKSLDFEWIMFNKHSQCKCNTYQKLHNKCCRFSYFRFTMKVIIFQCNNNNNTTQFPKKNGHCTLDQVAGGFLCEDVNFIKSLPTFAHQVEKWKFVTRRSSKTNTNKSNIQRVIWTYPALPPKVGLQLQMRLSRTFCAGGLFNDFLASLQTQTLKLEFPYKFCHTNHGNPTKCFTKSDY